MLDRRPECTIRRLKGEMPMSVEFYNVKTRSKVSVPEGQIQKATLKRQNKNGTTQIRYVLRALVDGMKLTKFVSQKDWEALNAPVVE
jgi:hypothetical protein